MQDKMAQYNVKLHCKDCLVQTIGIWYTYYDITKRAIFSLRQRLKILNWVKTYVNWTVEQWDNIIWRNETKISTLGSGGIKYVRRRIREDLHLDCVICTVKHLVLWVGRICRLMEYKCPNIYK